MAQVKPNPEENREILPNSSSMVLPPTVSFTPSTLLNRMEKALPHTPDTQRHMFMSTLGEGPALNWEAAVAESIRLTHQEVKRVLLVLLHHSTHEELASKQVGSHEGAILRHPDLIWAELHPVCSWKFYL